MFDGFRFVFFVSVLAVFWTVQAVDDPPNEQIFTQEVECSSAGGICIARESCPPEKLSEEGQCPKQSNAVCCHSVSITETRCQQLGGSCRDTCPEHLILARADDCGEGQKCCPLV